MPRSTTRSAAPEQPQPTGNRPVHEIRRHGLRAAIWRNQTEKGTMYNVTVSRSYRDERGDWHDSSSFGYDDLANLAKVLLDAHTAISAALDRERQQRGSEPVAPPAEAAPAETKAS